MTCSPARLAANRRNAALSRGPTSDQGKSRSRANAMKHGLTAEVLRTPDEQSATAQHSQTGSLAEWMGDEVVVLTMRIDRARQVEARERELAAMRAGACWDEDRARAADRIGGRIARRPDRAVRSLRATGQGCEWLIERWNRLLAAAGYEGGWTADHQALACDLRGLPEEHRGRTVEPGDQAVLAEREIRALSALRDALQPCDAFERESARLGLDDAASPGLRRAIRYEAALHRRLRWCLEQGRAESPPSPPLPSPNRSTDRPAEARPAPTPAAPRPAPGPALPPNDAWDPMWNLGFSARSVEVLPISMIPAGLRHPRE